MNDDVILLDPTAETSPVMRPRRARPVSLAGATIGILDIAKSRGDVFLDRIAELLRERGFTVERFSKPRFSIVAPTELKQAIEKRCQAVIEGLAD